MGLFGDILGGLGSGIGGLVGLFGSHEGGADERREMVKLWQKIQEPGFDMRELSPPELRKVATYFPQTYDAFIAGGPALPTEGPEGREMQLQTLSDLYGISREGLPLATRLAAKEASYRLAEEASRADAAIRGELAQRGRLGGGREGVLRSVAGQHASNLARGMGADLTQQEIATRMSALGQAASGAGALRGQDIQMGTARADAVNRFNEMISNLRTQAARDAAIERARTQTLNVGEQQRIADTNELARYGTAETNLNRLNALRQQAFGNQVTKATGQQGALAQKAAGKDAQQAAIMQTAPRIGQAFGGALGALGDMGMGGAFGGGGGGSEMMPFEWGSYTRGRQRDPFAYSYS